MPLLPPSLTTYKMDASAPSKEPLVSDRQGDAPKKPRRRPFLTSLKYLGEERFAKDHEALKPGVVMQSLHQLQQLQPQWNNENSPENPVSKKGFIGGYRDVYNSSSGGKKSKKRKSHQKKKRKSKRRKSRTKPLGDLRRFPRKKSKRRRH